MNVSEVKKQIIQSTLDGFYIFCGEEIGVQNIYINKIAEVKNQIIKRVDTVAEALSNRGLSLFSQSFCYVCRDDNDFLRADKSEKLWDRVDELVGQNTFIFLVTNIDKRGKFYHRFEDRIVTFDHLDPYLLRKYINQQVKIPKDTCDRLIDACEGDYNRIFLELNKVRCLCRTEKFCGIVAGDVLETLLSDGTIPLPPQDAIFDWVDAVLDGKPRLAYRLFEECQKIEKPVLQLLQVLYNNTKALLQVQGCEGNVAETTGLSGWEIRNARKHLGVYTNRELVAAMKLIKEMETSIKTGQVEEQWVVPYVMNSIIGGC